MLKSIFASLCKESKKQAVIYGISFLIVVAFSFHAHPDVSGVINKLNASGHIWKVFLGIFVLSLLMLPFDSTKKRKKK